jgi:hypothetical protein
MFSRQEGATDFETLENTLGPKNASRSIAIDGLLLQADASNQSVHVKGCNIGKAAWFMAKLKEAFGNIVKVTAPKHFHGLYRDPNLGVFEFMAYEFLVRRRSGTTGNSDELLDAFHAREVFRGTTFPPLLDGLEVNPDRFNDWIPDEANVQKTFPISFTAKLGVSIGGRTTIPARAEFDVDRKDSFEWDFTLPVGDPEPNSTSQREAAFQKHITNDPVFAQNLPHAFHKRVGYETIPDFMRGYTWKIEPKKNLPRSYDVLGTRVKYTVLIPITDGTGNLVFNFYPNSGSSPVRHKLMETDKFFFARV